MADRQSRRPSRRPSLRPPRPNDCTVTLPVEIDVQVKVRSKCKPWGSSRTRGGMSIEYPPEQQMLLNERLIGGHLNIEDSNGPIPVLHDILKKQQKILRNLESSTPLSMSSRKNLSLSAKSSDDEEEETKQNDNEEDIKEMNEKKFEKRNKSLKSKKYATKNVMRSLSEEIKVNTNISFDNKDEILKQDNKKSKKNEKRLKGGQTNIPLGNNFEDEDNSYQFDTKESQMVELFNRRKLKVSKIDQTNHAGENNKSEMDKDERTAQKDKNYGR